MSLILNTYALVPDGYTDTNWSLISAPSGFTPAIGTFPGLVYCSSTYGVVVGTSEWVSPTPLPTTNVQAGTYVYYGQFTYSGLSATTMTVSGFFVSDDTATCVINGNTLATTTATSVPVNFSSTTIPVNPGVNTVVVTVTNVGSVSGFQLNITSAAVTGSPTTTIPFLSTGCKSLTDPSIVAPTLAAVATYQNLITSEHANKPNFMAWVTILAQAFVDVQNCMLGIPLDYYIAQAQGVQLDAIGLWVGLSRNLNVPIGSVTTMDDATYQLILRAKAAANSWDSTIPTAASILNFVFAGTGVFPFLVDNQDMSETIGLVGAAPSALLLALIQQNYLGLKPSSVLLNVVSSSVPGAPIFGFDVENFYVSGFDVGAWGTVYTGA